MLPRESFSDHHSIDTPEQMQLQVALAGIGSRFLALALDTLIQIALLLVLVVAFAVVGSSLSSLMGPDAGPWIVGALLVGVFLIYAGYFAMFEAFWNGQTPGKRVVGIRVIKESGRPLGVGESIGRNLMRFIDMLPGFYGIGIVCALFNSQNKRLGDMLAGSILVREKAFKDLKPVWQAPSAAPPAVETGAVNVTLEDLRLIDAFLARRHSLDVAVRTRTALQILERLKVPMPVNRGITGPAESILEALSYQRRSTGHMDEARPFSDFR